MRYQSFAAREMTDVLEWLETTPHKNVTYFARLVEWTVIVDTGVAYQVTPVPTRKPGRPKKEVV